MITTVLVDGGSLHHIISPSYGPYGGFPKLGVPFWGPNNKDYSILGSILGVPLFSEITI